MKSMRTSHSRVGRQTWEEKSCAVLSMGFIEDNPFTSESASVQGPKTACQEIVCNAITMRNGMIANCKRHCIQDWRYKNVFKYQIIKIIFLMLNFQQNQLMKLTHSWSYSSLFPDLSSEPESSYSHPLSLLGCCFW